MKRKYHAPIGATSITVHGQLLEVNDDGILQCDDPAAHDVLLSHGYTVDAPVAAVADEKLPTRAELEERAEAIRVELQARSDALDTREAALTELDKRAAADLAEREAALDKRAADLAAAETDLALRSHAAGAAVPPPPPPAAAGKAKK